MMASLSALQGAILTTVLALILIGSPVAGLRPMRAGRLMSLTLPMPGRVMPFLLLLGALDGDVHDLLVHRDRLLLGDAAGFGERSHDGALGGRNDFLLCHDV